MALVPVYRLRNGAEHFYTIDPQERDNAVSQYGYVYEEIAFYAHDSDTPDPPIPPTASEMALVVVALATHLGLRASGVRDVEIESVVAKCRQLLKDWVNE